MTFARDTQSSVVPWVQVMMLYVDSEQDLFSQIEVSLRIQSPFQMVIGVYNHLLRKVFRFHYHSQKVIGSLGYNTLSLFEKKNENQDHAYNYWILRWAKGILWRLEPRSREKGLNLRWGGLAGSDSAKLLGVVVVWAMKKGPWLFN